MKSKMPERTKIFLISALIFVLISNFFSVSTVATTYETGIKPGIWMKYEFRHYLDIKELYLEVKEVNGTAVTLFGQITYLDDRIENQTATVEIGMPQDPRGRKIIVIPTNTTRGWVSRVGENKIEVKENYLRIEMKPVKVGDSSYSEVSYLFEEPKDLRKTIDFGMSLDEKEENEEYFFWAEDINGTVIYLPIIFYGQTDPRTKIKDYTVWERITLDLTMPSENGTKELAVPFEARAVKRIGIIYKGNSSRIINLKDICYRASPHDFDSLSYPLIAGGLTIYDQIYPDTKLIIYEVTDRIYLHTRRSISATYEVYGPGKYIFWRWDQETGILVKYVKALEIYREIELVDTNAWGPANIFAYIDVSLEEKLSPILGPNYKFWLIIAPVGIQTLAFVAMTIYCKWTRKALPKMKEMVPWIIVMIIGVTLPAIFINLLPLLLR